MTLPLRLLYVAVLQVILTSFITYFLITDEYRDLSEKNVVILENFLIEQKKQALKNYTSIALTSVNQAYDSPKKNSHQTHKRLLLIPLMA